MSINLDKSIEWFKSMSGTTYSMTGNRDGSDGTGDCSGMVVTALMKGGASNPGWLLNTDSMHDWLIRIGFELIAFNKSWDMKKGDVVILGLKGQSGGAAGHTFMAVDGTNAIDCAWYDSTTVNAVRVRNENVQPYSMGFYVYRLKTDNIEKPVEPSKPEINKPNPTPIGWYSEKATFKSNVGNKPIMILDSVPNGNIIGKIYPGDTVKYDAVKHDSGFVWVRQPRDNGEVGYVAIGEGNGIKRTKSWGPCY
ncbi:peptidoglycan amidohydrolase family protein [Vagococcus fluvialis]|uniref:peptidoglycan amidohydrolase family protein n=1 Tax=Vagococcus fluvialis TaxID=2738 RepID=UPI00288F57EB|nr:peptidoglycan amidohydrolase family protein [Vagococcus fluvialis]MDT2781376.1 peptidoglycan amidohydrolase family protein [Vagococcus fluvialis]